MWNALNLRYWCSMENNYLIITISDTIFSLDYKSFSKKDKFTHLISTQVVFWFNLAIFLLVIFPFHKISSLFYVLFRKVCLVNEVSGFLTSLNKLFCLTLQSSFKKAIHLASFLCLEQEKSSRYIDTNPLDVQAASSSVPKSRGVPCLVHHSRCTASQELKIDYVSFSIK